MRPGGMVAFATHGYEYYTECCEAGTRVFSRPRYAFYLLGLRAEIWFLKEKKAAKLLNKAGLNDIEVKRHLGKECFQSADQAYDFLSSTSGLCYAGAIPAEKRKDFFKDIREYFNKKDIREVTKDVVFAYGKKPG